MSAADRVRSLLAVEHGGGCRGDCGGAWKCNRCEIWVGYCLGAADDTPGICDDCLLAIGHIEDERCGN